ncbi:hypothetical protein C0992_009954 [Termitomyces sp. T32_za158]|nr:hypothetical protein C0992_009954 [Termitomyces sp. T32_za158]
MSRHMPKKPKTRFKKSSKIHAMTAVRLVDLTKEKKAKWQARKDEECDDDQTHSKDETS